MVFDKSLILKSKNGDLISVSPKFCEQFQLLKNYIDDFDSSNDQPFPLDKVSSITIDHLQAISGYSKEMVICAEKFPLLYGTKRDEPLNFDQIIDLLLAIDFLGNDAWQDRLYKVIGELFDGSGYRDFVNPKAFSHLPQHAIKQILDHIKSAEALTWLYWNEDVIYSYLKPIVQFQLETGAKVFDLSNVWPVYYVQPINNQVDKIQIISKLSTIVPFVTLDLKNASNFEAGDFPFGTRLQGINPRQGINLSSSSPWAFDPRFIHLYKILDIGTWNDFVITALTSTCLELLKVDCRNWNQDLFDKLAKVLKDGIPANIKRITINGYQGNDNFENSMLDSWFMIVKGPGILDLYKNY